MLFHHLCISWAIYFLRELSKINGSLCWLHAFILDPFWPILCEILACKFAKIFVSSILQIQGGNVCCPSTFQQIQRGCFSALSEGDRLFVTWTRADFCKASAILNDLNCQGKDHVSFMVTRVIKVIQHQSPWHNWEGLCCNFHLGWSVAMASDRPTSSTKSRANIGKQKQLRTKVQMLPKLEKFTSGSGQRLHLASNDITCSCSNDSPELQTPWNNDVHIILLHFVSPSKSDTQDFLLMWCFPNHQTMCLVGNSRVAIKPCYHPSPLKPWGKYGHYMNHSFSTNSWHKMNTF